MIVDLAGVCDIMQDRKDYLPYVHELTMIQIQHPLDVEFVVQTIGIVYPNLQKDGCKYQYTFVIGGN